MDSGLDFAINSDPVVRLAFFSGLGAVVLTLLLILQIVILRVLYRRNERHRNAFMSKWSGLLTECALGKNNSLNLPVIAEEEVVFFLAYWNHQYHSLSAVARQQLNSLAIEINIGATVRQMLHKGRNADKLLATIGIGFFGNKTDILVLRKLLVSERPIDCLHAANAMLRIDAETLWEVLPAMVRRSDIPTAGIAFVLMEVGPEKVSPVLADMLTRVFQVVPQQRIRQRDVVRLIMLAVTALPSVVNPCLRNILDITEDDEVKAACLKVMRDPADLKKIREYVRNPNWRVRVQAATALGSMGEENDLTILIGMLTDSQWWVRYRAAQAICSLPFVTTDYLEGLKKTLSDGFAINMIDHVLSERAL